jgi:hypothetical protein
MLTAHSVLDCVLFMPILPLNPAPWLSPPACQA